MKRITEFEPHLEFILREMCSRVDADPEKIDFKDDRWYMDHEWTPESEGEFGEWMAEYLRTNVKARREIMEFPSFKAKKHCRKAAAWFIFNYGWKTTKQGDWIGKHMTNK